MAKLNPPPPATRRHLPLLLLLFVGSGCSALIYEIVWFQLLQLVIGSTAVSLGVLLGTFMAACASAASPCRASSRRGSTRCGSTPCWSWASASSGSSSS